MSWVLSTTATVVEVSWSPARTWVCTSWVVLRRIGYVKRSALQNQATCTGSKLPFSYQITSDGLSIWLCHPGSYLTGNLSTMDSTLIMLLWPSSGASGVNSFSSFPGLLLNINSHSLQFKLYYPLGEWAGRKPGNWWGYTWRINPRIDGCGWLDGMV